MSEYIKEECPFPDHISTLFDYAKGQPFDYMILVGGEGTKFFQGFKVSPENAGRAIVWAEKMEEMGKEIREQIEDQIKKQKEARRKSS